jgi:hypothetical protein
MVRCLLIGDSHIPRRAQRVPYKIIHKLNDLTDQKLYDYTFFTGDLITASDFIDFLNLKTKNKVFIVMGNMDYFVGDNTAPIYEDLQVSFSDNEKMTIGLTHGAQIKPRGDHSNLEKLAIHKEYDILISGHTHKEEVFITNQGILLLNPGSVTGAWSFVASETPSFITLHINEESKEISVKIYQFEKNPDKITEISSYLIFKNNQIQLRY